MHIFDIIGPVMIGPSSSHTAGAVRIGLVAGKLLGERPDLAEITLYDSFAETGKGHGTDKAVIGGLLGFYPDDGRIPESLAIAAREGLSFSFACSDVPQKHPNTVRLDLRGAQGRRISVTGVSVGGGKIEIVKINTAEVSFNTAYHTLIVFSVDRFGTLAQISKILSEARINIAFMKLSREKEGEDVVMVIETDQEVPRALCELMKTKENINDIIYLQPF